MKPQALLAEYARLCSSLQEHLEQARELHNQAQQKLLEATRIQNLRYEHLVHGLQRINVQLGEIFPSLKPGGESYISYPSDPISMFAEGIKILTQFGGGPWRQVINK